MAEPCQEILNLACQKPIPPGPGLPAWQEPNSKIRMQHTFCVFNRTRESFLCLSAAAGGALGFPPPPSEDGILLVTSPGVCIVGAPFPMDLVYLNRGNRVIDLIEHLDPLRIAPMHWLHASVLAVRTRTIYWSGTRVGDELLICSPEEMLGHWT